MRLVRRLVRRDPEQDRVVPVIDRLHLQDRLFPLARGVVARPLAERPLGQLLVVMEIPDEHDLRGGGDRQLGDRVDHDLVRLAADPTGPVVLGYALRHLERRGDEQQRLDAADDRDRAGLAALEIGVAELPPVLAG